MVASMDEPPLTSWKGAGKRMLSLLSSRLIGGGTGLGWIGFDGACLIYAGVACAQRLNVK